MDTNFDFNNEDDMNICFDELQSYSNQENWEDNDISFKPNALEKFETIQNLFQGKIPLIFLDYDGTLIPYTHDPSQSNMRTSMANSLQRLTENYTVSIITGRDAKSIMNVVEIENIYFSCCHGFEIFGPNNTYFSILEEDSMAPMLEKIHNIFKDQVVNHAIENVWIEEKKYAVTVHFDEVSEHQKNQIETIANVIIRLNPDVKCTFGKDILDIQPNIEWNKGKALKWLENRILSEQQNSNVKFFPIYLGDDLSDEEAFKVLVDNGLGIAVHSEPKRTEASYTLINQEEVEVFLNNLNLLAELARGS